MKEPEKFTVVEKFVESRELIKQRGTAQILKLFPNEEDYVRCSRCGKKVSNTVRSSIPEGLVVRAFIECLECVEKQPNVEEIRKQERKRWIKACNAYSSGFSEVIEGLIKEQEG